jgi:2-iminobutanoate/2-iminopropanoate deaminase
MSGIPLSQHCIHGDVVYTAGQVDRETDGMVLSGFARQMELAMASLGRQLEDAGSALAQVLKATVFIVRREDFAEMSCSWERPRRAAAPARLGRARAARFD